MVEIDIKSFRKSGYTTDSIIPIEYYDELKIYHPKFNSDPTKYKITTEYTDGKENEIKFTFPDRNREEWSDAQVAVLSKFQFFEHGILSKPKSTLISNRKPVSPVFGFSLIDATISLNKDMKDNLIIVVKIQWEKNDVRFYTYWFWRPVK